MANHGVAAFVFATPMFTTNLYISVVESQSCKLNVLGSIPSGGWGHNTLQMVSRSLEDSAGPFAEVAMAARRWVACTARG